ncbi:hypothetical protein J2X69_003471 [Algoriphagus sp. 4150]|uniref:hypothetical protein n=1 Tax=Algoriphagus sp. 4150 TaxID=2817756 RepID=UPI002858F3D8|nr:hypothetical protein [Algoriphagus sp. 4150]MDR7131111.1 hypothetical protein [Algoriphagus sp. 4150]
MDQWNRSHYVNSLVNNYLDQYRILPISFLENVFLTLLMPSNPTKYLLLFTILLLFLPACQSKNSDLYERSIDTLDVEFSDFRARHLYRIERQKLIKSTFGDTATFIYFDSLMGEKYRSYSLVKSQNGSYKLLKHRHLGYVNEFIVLDSILLLKYESIDPPMDGDGALILNPEFGEIANYSYTWENSLLLTKYDGIRIPNELIEELFSDSISSPSYYYQNNQ